MFRLLVRVSVLVTLGLLIYGCVHRNDSHSAGADTTPPTSSATTVPCPVHSADGAALAAKEGLDALTAANLGRVDITTTVDRYVAEASQNGEQTYLTEHPAPFADLTSKVTGWEPVTYTPDQATIRLATSDVVTNPDGTTLPPQDYVTTVAVDWTAGAWHLVSWHHTAVLNAVAQLTTPRSLCA